MAQRTTIPLLGPDYSERSTNVNAQRTINLWPRLQKPGSKSVLALYPTPGLTQLCYAGNGPNRGNGVVFQDKAFMVSGNGLYSIDTSGTSLLIGTLNTSGGRVHMVAGRDYLMLVDGTDGWTYNGTAFAQITDVDFPAGVTHVAYLDGYFIVNEGDSDQFWISSNEDPTAWNALDFAAATAKPDNTFALATTNKDLYIFGLNSIEIYYNSGNPDFPLTRYTGGVVDFGIRAPNSLVEGSAGLFFLATAEEGGVAIVQIDGFQAQNISDDIGYQLTKMTTVNDAEGMFYRFGERSYYQITFPTEGKTFEYIIEDGLWVERKTYGLTRYEVNGHIYLGTKNIFGQYDTGGNYYYANLTGYDDDGTPIERIRVTQPIHQDGRRITFSQLVLEVQSGVGTVTGQGANPLVMMRYSDDGAHTWSNELTGSMGSIGEYNAIVQWDKLGQSTSRIFEFRITDPVETIIINAYARVVVHND